MVRLQRAVFSKPGGQGGTGGTPPPSSGTPPPSSGGTPPAGAGGGTGQASGLAPVDAPGPQLRAFTGTPDMEPMVASELSARGLARADAHGLLLDMTNAILNRINDEIQRRRAQEQMRALEPEVERVQRERPDCGVLLIPILRQLQPDGFSAIVPGPALVRTEMGSAATCARRPSTACRSTRAPPDPPTASSRARRSGFPRRAPSTRPRPRRPTRAWRSPPSRPPRRP